MTLDNAQGTCVPATCVPDPLDIIRIDATHQPLVRGFQLLKFTAKWLRLSSKVPLMSHNQQKLRLERYPPLDHPRFDSTASLALALPLLQPIEPSEAWSKRLTPMLESLAAAQDLDVSDFVEGFSKWTPFGLSHFQGETQSIPTREIPKAS